MLKRTMLVATVAATLGAVGFSSQASAHDPIAGALIGGGIGAAIAGPPGAAVGAIIGTIAGAESHHYYAPQRYGDVAYDNRRYYAPEPAYYPPAPTAYYAPEPAYYQPAPTYYAPPAPVYYAPAYYEPAPVYRGPAVVYRSPRAFHDAPRREARVRTYDGYREARVRPYDGYRDGRGQTRHRDEGNWRRY